MTIGICSHPKGKIIFVLFYLLLDQAHSRKNPIFRAPIFIVAFADDAFAISSISSSTLVLGRSSLSAKNFLIPPCLALANAPSIIFLLVLVQAKIKDLYLWTFFEYLKCVSFAPPGLWWKEL